MSLRDESNARCVCFSFIKELQILYKELQSIIIFQRVFNGCYQDCWLKKFIVKFKKLQNIKGETGFFTIGLLRAFNFVNFQEGLQKAALLKLNLLCLLRFLCTEFAKYLGGLLQVLLFGLLGYLRAEAIPFPLSITGIQHNA